MPNFIPSPIPAWVLMWLLMLLLYLVGKILASIPLWRCSKPRDAILFLLFWVGMNPEEWLQRNDTPTCRLKMDAAWGAGFLVSGIVMMWYVARQLEQPFLQGWCGLISLAWMLHFGIFRLLAVFWQWQGRHVKAVMQSPVTATSLARFWSHSWNRAFRDLVHPLVFSPVKKRFGPMIATLVTFTVSGFLHELIFTIPAGAAYGLPLTYFLIQAIGILIERRLQWQSWWFTHAFTVLPIALVFPPPLLLNVIHPFMHAIGALEG